MSRSQINRYTDDGRLLVDAAIPASSDVNIIESIPLFVRVNEVMEQITTSQDLAVDPLDFTTAIDKQFKLNYIAIAFTDEVSEIVTISVIPTVGVAYETIMSEVDLVDNQFVFIPQSDMLFAEGDEIRVQCTNAGGAETVNVVISISNR